MKSGISCSRLDISGEHLESGRFSSAVDAKQTEAFSRWNANAYLVDGQMTTHLLRHVYLQQIKT